MDKIVGFTVSRSKIDHENIDVFDSKLNLLQFEKCGFYIYLWGMNKIENCIVDEKYTLSPQLSDSLLDRNVLIYFENGRIIIENDWLGSIPVFYNEREIIVSTLSLKVQKSKEIHPEGLTNFVEFGYSVLEQTPFKDVKFMKYFSKLVINQKGIEVIYKKDPVLIEGLFSKVENEEVVFKKIKRYINRIENNTSDEIIIPTSGGYDSRLLNICINNRPRVRSFTYGISDNQSNSFEVINARKISELLGIRWEQIELGAFHKYIDDWFSIYGVSTHLHGMYQIEFYKKIIEQNLFGENSVFLSGIVGDAWSGKVSIDPIVSYNEVTKLAYSHGANADKDQLVIKSDEELRKAFFHENEVYLKNEKIRIIFLVRFKLILLSYLIIIPEYFGFPVFTPFLDFDIVTSMLNIPENRREKRKWQIEIFKRYDLDIESINLLKDFSNTLNYQAYINHDFEQLDLQVLSKYFNRNYLNMINETMSYKPSKTQEKYDRLFFKIRRIRYIRFMFRKLNLKYGKRDILIVFPYYITKTIEMALTYKKI